MTEQKQVIPEGYKQTEVGVIPDDWECVLLKDIASFGGGTTPPRNQYEKYYRDGIHPWVKTLDLNNKNIISTEELVTDAALIETSLKKHERGSVLVAMYGGFNQIGRTGLLTVNAAINQALVAIIPNKNKLDSDYLLFNLNYHVDYWKLVASSSRKDPNITSNDVKNFKIATPSKQEQTAIANALSDVDALITELEKLIAKKQAIKTATMQQLLTGKTRLPEFALREDGTPKGYKQSELGEIPEDWAVYGLPEIIWYQEGPGLRKWQFTTKGLKVINVTNLQESGYLDLDKTDRHISWDEYEKTYKHFLCDEDDLVIASSGNSYCKASTVRACDLPLLMNTSVIRFKPIGKFSKGFMDVFLKSENFKEQIDLLITGGAQPNFGPAHLNKIKIPAPICGDEQIQISSILLSINDEIQCLQNRVNKNRQIKQGMMQELLTGKTRLVQGS